MKQVLLALLFVSTTALSCPRPSMFEAAVFDTATTNIGLTMSSTAVELNPLGVVGATIGRLIILLNEDKIDVDTQATASAIWMGAGVHNVVHAFGLAFAPSIMLGIIAGLAINKTTIVQKETNMSDGKVDVNKKVDELEAAAKKYASKDTIISIGGYEFTPAKLMIAFGIVSSVIGGLYGVFETYKDYMGMKKKIAEYVAPDFSEYEARIIKLEENSEKVVGYTRDINQNLKGDIRRTEGVLENVERGTKTAQREVEKDINDFRRQVDSEIKEIRKSADNQVREMQKQVDATVQNVNERVNRIERETSAELRTIRREVDDKIKKALDNPLAN